MPSNAAYILVHDEDGVPQKVSHDGGIPVPNVSQPYTAAYDYDVSANLIYAGVAKTGSSKASAVWQIKKLTYDGSGNLTDSQFAGGVPKFNSIWNNRASLSYS